MSETRPKRPMGGPMMGGKGPMAGGPAGVMEKPKSFKGTMLRLLKYSKSYALPLIVAIFAALAGSSLHVLGPNNLKRLANEISKGLPQFLDGNWLDYSVDLNAVKIIAFQMLLILSSALVLKTMQGWLMAGVTQKITKQLRKDISIKINKLPLKYFDKTSQGDVLSRVTNDVDAIGQSLNQSVGSLVTALAMFFGSLGMMIYNSWILALVAIACSFLGFLLMMYIIKKSQKYFSKQQYSLGEINGHIEEVYTGHNVVKIYNGSKEEKLKFEEINDKLYSSSWISQFLSGLMMPLMGFIGNFGYVAVCVIGAALAMQGRISFGVIVAFMVYIRLFTQPLSQIAQVFNSLQRAAAASERVFDLLDEKELDDERKKQNLLKDIKGNVDFSNVKFGYSKDKIVINDFSVNIKAGQKVAIVGPTGAGKTTVVNLLMRFYELDEGEILLDNIPISQVPRENVHEQFGMVLQDTWLFEGTIRDNIIYNLEGVTNEDVVKTCKTIGLHHFIKTLPKGYDTILNTKTAISEGQKQLITIARAMIQNAPLLILDEATSSVDTRTERIVQKAMDTLTAGRTSFVIAHRLSTIKNADIILVMNKGDIVESGNHDELIAKGGFYADLYNSQFEYVA